VTGAASYQIEISSNINFSGRLAISENVLDKSGQLQEYCDNLNYRLLSNTNYYWRVRAIHPTQTSL